MSATELPEGRTICQSAPPVAQQFRMEVGALGASTGQRDDPAVTLRGVAEVDRGVELGVEAVDVP